MPLHCKTCGVCIHTFVYNCVDFALRNTICKHIHAVVAIFKPELVCTALSQVVSEDPVMTKTIPATYCVYEYVDDDSEMTDVPEQVVLVTARSVKLDETSSLLDSLASRSSDNSIDHYVSEAQDHWTCIRAQITDNVEVATAACEELKRVKAYLSALKHQPQLPQLPHVHKPVNKKLEHQHYFASTKKVLKKCKSEQAGQLQKGILTRNSNWQC